MNSARVMPADEDGQDDPGLDDEIGGGDLEGHGGREVTSLPDDLAGDGHRRVRARRRGALRGRSPPSGSAGEPSGRRRLISLFETAACTAPDRTKPRMSAQVTSHVMENARFSA
jgi:hypothetical protein